MVGITFDTFEKIVDAIFAELPDRFPNWGTLRRLRLGKKAMGKCNTDDYWTRTPLKK